MNEQAYCYDEPRDIRDLRRENKQQNERIQRIEIQVGEVKTYLIGIDGRNGIRGEVKDIHTQIKELNENIQQLRGLPWKLTIQIGGLMGGLGGLGLLIYEMIRNTTGG